MQQLFQRKLQGILVLNNRY